MEVPLRGSGFVCERSRGQSCPGCRARGSVSGIMAGAEVGCVGLEETGSQIQH